MITGPFYHGRLSIGFLILTTLVGVSLYSIINLSKYGQFFGKSDFNKINLIDLLSYGTIHNRKNICTEGFFVKTQRLSILKVSLDEDQYTRSAWVKTNEDIITQFPGVGDRYVKVEICGYFESSRDGEFGEPPVWNHQITESGYKTLDDVQRLEKSF